MKFTNTYSPAHSYHSAEIYGGAEDTDPHHLIEMLFNGLLEKINQTAMGIKNGDVGAKCNAVSKALNILDALRTALNFENGGKVATNLDDLYDYVQRRLVIANQNSDLGVVNEVSSLVSEICEAWKSIPPEKRSVPNNSVNQN